MFNKVLWEKAIESIPETLAAGALLNEDGFPCTLKHLCSFGHLETGIPVNHSKDNTSQVALCVANTFGIPFEMAWKLFQVNDTTSDKKRRSAVRKQMGHIRTVQLARRARYESVLKGLAQELQFPVGT